jgi:Rieske 2Fe-2S family protein
VLISRTRKGGIRAFYNVCRHRGVKLCMEEQGEAARSFQCPYHAWTYDFEGKLIAAFNLTKMPDIDRDEYGLVKVHIREYLGYVWVRLADDEPPSFEEDVMGAIEERLGDLRAVPTGSSSSRTSWSATTAPPSTPNSRKCCLNSPTAWPHSRTRTGATTR